jgi:glucosyl-3-phosphoglycerate phosphatase
MSDLNIEALFALAAAPPLECAVDHFYFCRHGQTEGNFNRIFQPPHIPLNATGRAQAAKAAETLRAFEIREIFCSDYRRAHETGATIAEITGRTLTIHEGLRERSFGDLIGTSSAGLDWSASPPNGETLEEFVLRTKAGLTEILSMAGPSPLLVAHGGTLRVLVAALGATVEEEARQNATPLSIERRAGGWKVSLL